MKKLLLLIPLLFSIPSFSQTESEIIGPFGNLNNRDNPMAIPNNMAQDMLNVDVTPGGKSIKKRPGYGLVGNMSNSTSPIHGIYTFYNSAGNNVVLSFNDRNINSSVSGAAFSVIYSTGTNGSTYQCSDTLGIAYCANTSRNLLLKTDGTTVTPIPNVASTGTMVTNGPDRLAMSGFAEAPNRIDFSQAGDFTVWKLGINNTDPINFTITSPGAKITHITYQDGKYFWFKNTSFGYILPGQAQTDWTVRTLDSGVGTNDNTSIYREGILYFRGQDSHIYSWDGSNLQKLTRDIQGTINLSQTKASNAWTQTSVGDWNAGYYDKSIYVDTQTFSDSIATTYPETFDYYRNGTSGTRKVWYSTYTGIGSVGVESGNLKFYCNSVTCSEAIISDQKFNTMTSGSSFYFEIKSLDSVGNPNLIFSLLETRPTSIADLVANDKVQLTLGKYSSSRISLDQFSINGTDYSSSVSTFTLPASILIYLNSSVANVTVNNSSTVFNVANTWVPKDAHGSLWLTSISVATSTIDNFTVVPQTFTYSSQIIGFPNLSSWDTFSADYSVGGGSHSFAIRSATYQIVNASTFSYVPIISGNIPSVTISTWFQIRDYFSNYSTNSVVLLNSFTQNFYEGNATDKAYASYYKDSNWWSVASGTGASSNNAILRQDLINGGWNIYDIKANGMFSTAKNMYFGSSTAGKFYKYGDTNNDDGSSINAYWKSKDFFGSSPFLDKDYQRISVAASAQSNSTVNTVYTIDGVSNVSYSMNCSTGTRNYVHFNRNFPLGSVGTHMNVKFGNNAADQPFEIFGSQLDYTPRSWNITNP